MRETSSKTFVTPIVSVYSYHQFAERDKYLFESSVGTQVSSLQQFKCDANKVTSDTVICSCTELLAFEC